MIKKFLLCNLLLIILNLIASSVLCTIQEKELEITNYISVDTVVVKKSKNIFIKKLLYYLCCCHCIDNCLESIDETDSEFRNRNISSNNWFNNSVYEVGNRHSGHSDLY